MRSLLTIVTVTSLLAATGLLAADVLIDVSVPLSRPGLLLVTSALIVFVYRLQRSRRQRFLRAIDTYVQRQSLRDMEVELQRERERRSTRSLSDSQMMQRVAT